MMEGIRTFWGFTKTLNHHPIITLPVFLATGGWMFGGANAASPAYCLLTSEYFFSWPKYAYANLEWLFTGTYSSLPTTDMVVLGPLGRSFTAFFPTLVSIIFGLCMAAATAWAMKGVKLGAPIAYKWSKRAILTFAKDPQFYLKKLGGWIAFPFVFAWKFFCSLTKDELLLALRYSILGVFYPTAGLLIVLAKTVALFFKLIHSARRLATGLSTLLGGAIYMVFLPFTVEGLPVPLAALLCGATTGAVTTVVQILLDGERVGSWLNNFLKKPIHSYVPNFNS